MNDPKLTVYTNAIGGGTDSLSDLIPLLGPRPFSDFTPEEYKTYVRSLYEKAAKKEKTIKLKKKQEPFVWKLTPKGNLSLKVNRDPKWLSREEIEQIVRESKLPANEVWLKVLDKRSSIRISSQEEEFRIARELAEIPWPASEPTE
jgi:hypothetical protein